MPNKTILKIGFDFDGVIAYNPLRVLRLPLNLASKLLFGKKIINYYPTSRVSQFFWKAAHRLSLFAAVGFSELKKLLEEGKIEGYLITGRYVLLEDDLKRWLKRHKAENLFKGCYINRENQPPHKFKSEMVQKLKLDYFVEDNWDIVHYLNESLANANSKLKLANSKKARLQLRTSNLERGEAACSIHWIYNILDRRIKYPRKHPHLQHFLKSIM